MLRSVVGPNMILCCLFESAAIDVVRVRSPIYRLDQRSPKLDIQQYARDHVGKALSYLGCDISDGSMGIAPIIDRDVAISSDSAITRSMWNY